VEYAKLALQLVQAVAWPVTVLVVAFGFRKEVAAILGRLAQLQKAELPGGLSVDFAVAEARQLSREVEAQPSPNAVGPSAQQIPSIPLTEANARAINLGLQPSPSGLNLDYYRNLARQDPNLALAGLRIELDIAARNLGKGFKVPTNERDSGRRLFRKLLKAGAITDIQCKLAEQVLEVCNAAVHGSRVSRDQADSVIGSAGVLLKEYFEWLSWGFPDGWEPQASAKDQ
jgi:hypothetical protein